MTHFRFELLSGSTTVTNEVKATVETKQEWMEKSGVDWVEMPSLPVGSFKESSYPAPPHNIRAIFFDLDGVLVDAPDWHRDAFNETMEDFSQPRVSNEEHLTKLNGLSTRKKLALLTEWERLHPSYKGEDFVDEFYNLKQAHTIEIIKERCKPITRVIDTCVYAKSAYRTAVVTNCSRSTCELMLELSGLSGLFEFIITNEDVGGNVKPHPLPYLMAKYRMGLKCREALAIDDTYRGISSAMEAGLRIWKLKEFEHLSVKNLMHIVNSYRITL